MAKLNQILAIEKGAKTRTYAEVTALHHASQKADLMTGHHKTYSPMAEDGEKLPPETRKVKYKADDVIEEAAKALASLFDVTAAKDWANCTAKASVMLNGEVFLEEVPVTYLLFLDKQLGDLLTFVSKMVELDPGETWTHDDNSGEYRTSPTETAKTKKLQKPIVLYQATETHPAQTQLITEDVVVGHYKLTKFSGAIPGPRKKALVAKIVKLSEAVKFAREQANAMEADKKDIGSKVLGFIFAE
jgi:hypothetical protein